MGRTKESRTIVGSFERTDICVDLNIKGNRLVSIDLCEANENDKINLYEKEIKGERSILKDEKRSACAKALGAIYKGVAKIKDAYYKNIIELCNFYFLISDHTLFNKRDIANGTKKNNSFGESLIRKRFKECAIVHLSETTFCGWSSLNKNIDLFPNTKEMLESVRRSIIDEVVVSNDGKRLTFLSIIDSGHHDKYDGAWNVLNKEKFFNELGISFVEVDTRKFGNLNEFESQKKLFDEVSKKCGIDITIKAPKGIKKRNEAIAKDSLNSFLSGNAAFKNLTKTQKFNLLFEATYSYK